MKPARAPDPRIVYRDEHVLVLDKPAFLPTTSPDGGDCLVRRAEALDPRAQRLHPTSRLDAEVTGVVTFARTTHAIEAIARARSEGRYRRRYLALAHGALSGDSIVWDAPIGIDPKDARKRVVHGHKEQKHARTIAEPELVLSAATLLVLWPRTGRTHQLRVHAAHAGHALLGDTPYGGAKRIARADGRMVAFPRVMLHCAEVILPAITRDRTLELRAPLHDDFVQVFRALGGDERLLAIACARAPRGPLDAIS